jgi:hypothetical protein
MNEDLLVTQELIDQVQAAMQPRAIAAGYSANYNDNILMVDTTASDVPVLLPPARNGKEFIIVKRAAGHAVVVMFSAGDQCFGSAIVTLTALGESKRFKSIPGGFITL